MFDCKRIRFVTCSGVPYERIQYLESLGVKAWPTGDIQVDKETGIRTCTILVPAAQHLYAAGLLQGAGGTQVLDPHPVAPIRPRTRWGATRRAQGFLASTLRPVAAYLGVNAKVPPIAPKPARAKKATAGKSATAKRGRKPTKRKSTKPGATKRLWDSLSDE